MPRVYTLTKPESDRLQRAIAGCLVNPFVDDILSFNWEAIWHYCKSLPIPDPLAKTRKKDLYDAVDSKNQIGWSLKTQQLGKENIEPGASYAVVIARADILGKAEGLGYAGMSRKSKPDSLGSAVLKIWRDKFDKDGRVQAVKDSRVCTLLKRKDRVNFRRP